MNKKTFLLFSFTFIFSFSVFSLINKHDSELAPKRPVPGTEDNPYGAAQFRYDMIKGKADIILPTVRQKAIEYSKKNMIDNSLKKSESISAWTPLGPGNIGGRIRSIIIRPTNSNHILVGGVSGGIWKTIDGGANWIAKNDDGSPIAIGCMVNDGDVVYAGTGEGWGNADAVYGGGIWKSTDFGENWNLLTSTLSNSGWDFKNVKQLTKDPSGNIYAVTKAYNYKGGAGIYYANGGLWMSSDDGENWEKINKVSTNYYNGTAVVSISSSNILFATYAGGIFRTINGGADWTKMTSILPISNFGRIEMTQDPNTANIVYAVFHDNRSSSLPGYDGLINIYKSTDGGVTWTALTKPGPLASVSNRSYLNTQGWYNNVIAIDPHNSNNIYIGGVETMKSTDGGSSWSQMTVWHPYYQTPRYSGNPPYAHADHHAIVFDPNTANVIYLGNDGGIFKSTDAGASWTDLNNGLEITQYYGGAVSASGSVYMGGTQDNGHHKYDGSGTDWTEVKGGDGGYAAIDQSNSMIAYEEYVYLDISKTTNGGNNWSDCQTGLTDAQDGNTCLFISPFSMNPDNSSVLVAGSDNVWLTNNSAGSWTSSSSTLSSGAKVSAVTADGSTSPYLGFAGTTDGKVFKCTSMTGSGDSWSDISPHGNNGAYVRRITVDPNDNQKIYACYSGYNNTAGQQHIYYSSNQGTNWSDISTSLPDVPVHSLVIDPNDGQKLYIGTETGVYQTLDRGTNWTKAGSGMPDYVPVDELVLQSSTNKLFAFTHGRSVFVTTTPVPVELTNFSVKKIKNKIILNWQTATEVNNYGFEIERASTSLTTILNEEISSRAESREWKKIGFVEGHGNSNSPKDYTFYDSESPNGMVKYRLKQIDTDGTFEYSEEIEIEVESTIENKLVGNYPNPFNPTTKIRFDLAREGDVAIVVYNVIGEVVEKLVDHKMVAGRHQVEFDASHLSSGIYFYRLNAGTFVDVKKMMIIK